MQDVRSRETITGLASPAAVFALLTAVLVLGWPSVLHDGDTYTHIAAGEWMLAHGAALDHDPFSATFAGQPWNAHEWLAEVLMAAVFRMAGLTGVLLLAAGAGAAAFANLARHVSASAGYRATLLLVAGALVCALPSMLARPHLLALPLVEAWVAALLVARRRREAPGWWLLGIMVAWANMHGGFAFGLAFGAALAMEASLEKGTPRRVAWRWWGFMAAATGAALLTPQGWSGLMFPLRLLRMQSLPLVQEWQPVVLSRDHAFEVVLLGMVVLLGSGRVRLPWFRLLLLVGLLHLALAHARHGVLFGVAGALILAEPVGRAFAEARWRAVLPARREACWAGMALAVLAAGRLALPVAMANGPATPVAAVAQVPAALMRTPVLNSNQFGGYLALAGLRPFIDGRLELFGDGFVAEYLAMAQPDGEKLRWGIERYGVRWAVLSLSDPLVARFEKLPGWRREYADEVAVVFVQG